MSSINLIKNKRLNTEDYLYKEQYAKWKSLQKECESKFFILYKEFDEYLKYISSGALKLYIYYGFQSKNETGESWFATETISNFFGVSQRSVNAWNNELLSLGLIYRADSGEKTKTTYLIPFTTNIISINKTEKKSFIRKNLSNKVFLKVYGERVGVFHLFQWRKTSDKVDKYNDPYHALLIVFSKKSEANICHNTGFIIPLDDIKSTIDTNKIYDDAYTFKNDLQFEGIDKDSIQGLVIKSEFNIKSKQVLKDIVDQLADPSINFNDFNKVNLINDESGEEKH